MLHWCILWYGTVWYGAECDEGQTRSGWLDGGAGSGCCAVREREIERKRDRQSEIVNGSVRERFCRKEEAERRGGYK